GDRARFLSVNPDLEPVATLTACEEYQRLADGSPVIQLLLPFDADTLAGRISAGRCRRTRCPAARVRGDVIAIGLTCDGRAVNAATQLRPNELTTLHRGQSRRW